MRADQRMATAPEASRTNPSLRERCSFIYRSTRMRLRPIVQRISWSGLGDYVHDPVFIMGSTRSGKTIIRDILNEHPDIAAYPGEANHLWHPATHPWRYSPYRDGVPPFWGGPAFHTQRSLKLHHSRQGAHIRTVFGVFSLRNGQKIFLLDSAKITFMTSFITSLFPDARFINMIRDGRAVAFTQATKLSREIREWSWIHSEHGYAPSFDELAARCALSWQAHAEEADRVLRGDAGVPPDRVTSVRYEDFCQDPMAILHQLCAFIGVEPGQLPDPLPVTIRNHNAEIDPGSPEIGRIAALISDTLERFGYRPDIGSLR